MKSLVIALLTLSSVAFANSNQHSKIAESTILNLYGRPGDTVSIETKVSQKPSYDVILSNGADAGGSAVYNVEIDQTPTQDNGGEVLATIKVRFVDGN